MYKTKSIKRIIIIIKTFLFVHFFIINLLYSLFVLFFIIDLLYSLFVLFFCIVLCYANVQRLQAWHNVCVLCVCIVVSFYYSFLFLLFQDYYSQLDFLFYISIPKNIYSQLDFYSQA